MSQSVHTVIPDLIERHYQRLLDGWLACQKREGVVRGQITEGQLAEQTRRFLAEVRKGVEIGHFDDLSGPEWDATRNLLDTVASERAVQASRHRRPPSSSSPSRSRCSTCCARKSPMLRCLRVKPGSPRC